jgi:hypothetical protein
VRLVEVWPELNSALASDNGFIVAAKVMQNLAKIAVGLRVVGLETERLSDQLNRLVGAAGLYGEHAKQMQARGVIRISGERLQIEPFGLGEPGSLMKPNGGAEAVLCRRRPIRGMLRISRPIRNGRSRYPGFCTALLSIHLNGLCFRPRMLGD